MVDETKPVILTAAEAKRRYLIYIAMKLAGLAALFGGVFLARDHMTGGAIALMGVGLSTLFVRPRMIGLTTKRPGA